jgi:hypothetical protein
MVRRIPIRRDSERGSITVMAAVFVIALCGLTFAVLTDVAASKKVFERGEAGMRALEAAETGLARSEVEISSKQDPDKDGLGTLTGTFAGATYQVTATQDPVLTQQWTISSRGSQGMSVRTLEARIIRTPKGTWNYAMYGGNSITLGGGSNSDAYDSRKGTYLSQVTGADKFGSYAQETGSIASNGNITVQSSDVRGDSNAGPGYSTTITGTGQVTGSTADLPKALSAPDTPLLDFVKAATVNDNGNWSSNGGLNYNPVTKVLQVSGGHTLTLNKSTYFFSQIILSGNSTLKITGGPVKVYVTDVINFSGGVIVNQTDKPSNLQFLQEPYPLPVGYVPTVNSATFTGGSQSDFTFYGPSTPVTLTGKGTVFGAVAGKSITVLGGTPFHYDMALVDEMDVGNAAITRIYWRDTAPPQR